MMKRLSVGICGVAVMCMTAGLARANSTAQDVKDRTATAAHQSGTYLSDTEITSAVKSKLLAAKGVSGSNIHVETNDGVVMLSGRVDSAAERSRAMSIARRTHGVRRVVDKIAVGREHASNGVVDRSMDSVKGTSGRVERDAKDAAKKTGRFFSDAEITSAVKTKLAADSGVHSMDVHVDTDRGVVTLTGDVRNDAERANAVRIARKTMGVKRVVDNLNVR